MNDYSPHSDYTVNTAASVDRATFIRQTYLHVAGAVGAFVLLESMLLASPLAPALGSLMLGGKWSWLIVLGLFMFVSHIATKWASTATSIGGQYAGLGLYVVAEVIILCPLLMLASRFGEGLILKAGLITGGVFIGLTWVAFTSGKDFSFLGGFLKVGFFVALATIVVGIAFGFNLGLWFTGAMLLLVGGSILYQTSNVMHHYHPSQYVAASLALFASIATLFWYVLQLLMSLNSRD
ncbi:MAG: Bax inhibitor-1 family protein [Verrucomicrobiota bacterium]